MSALRLFAALWLAASLAGCGFHPRGAVVAPSADLQPLQLSGLAAAHPFMRVLRRQLTEAGVQLAESREAAVRLRILDLDRKRRVFSVNANNKAVEYEFVYRLRWRLEKPPGTVILRPEPLVERRIVYEPGGELLGRVREAGLREQDVHADLAARLIRRLAAAP